MEKRAATDPYTRVVAEPGDDDPHATMPGDHRTMTIRDRGNSPGAGAGWRWSVLVLTIFIDV
jgi:hypothetical protein